MAGADHSILARGSWLPMNMYDVLFDENGAIQSFFFWNNMR